MNRLDSFPPYHAITLDPAPFGPRFTYHSLSNTVQCISLWDSCRRLSNRNSSQPHRMTRSHSAVTVGVWMSGLVCERTVEDTGSGPGIAVLRKVLLKSERILRKLRQKPLYYLKFWGGKVPFFFFHKNDFLIFHLAFNVWFTELLTDLTDDKYKASWPVKSLNKHIFWVFSELFTCLLLLLNGWVHGVNVSPVIGNPCLQSGAETTALHTFCFIKSKDKTPMSCHLIVVEKFVCPNDSGSYVVRGFKPLVGSPKANRS